MLLPHRCLVPPCSKTSLGYSAVRGFIQHGTLYCLTGVQRVRCPCIRNFLLPFQHDGLWSRASHARRELVRAAGLHTLPKLSAVSTYVDSTAAHRLARGPPSWTAGGGLDRTTKAPEPTGRAACCPLRVCQPTAPYGVRPATRGCISLENGRSTARSEYTRPCAPLRSPATTGANGAGPVGAYGRCDSCSHEDLG